MNTYNTLVERRKANEHKQRALTFFQLYQKLTKGASPWGHSAQQPANFWDFHFFTSPFSVAVANQPTTHRKITNICESRSPITWPHSLPHQKTKWTVVQYVSRVFHRQKETLRELYAVARESTAPVTRNIKPPIWSTKIYVCFAEHLCF